MIDSSGWIEFLTRGSNAGVFEQSLREPALVIVPTVVIYEVTRYARRVGGDDAADRILARMQQADVVPLDATIAVEAARIGKDEKLALADSVILATARQCHAEFWTQDADFRDIPGVHYVPKPVQ